MSLQHANHHTRVLWSRTAHSQVFQSRVGPEAAGNSAIQIIRAQFPARDVRARSARAANSQVGQRREGPDAGGNGAIQLIRGQVPARDVGATHSTPRIATHNSVTRLPSPLHATPNHVHARAEVFPVVHPPGPARGVVEIHECRAVPRDDIRRRTADAREDDEARAPPRPPGPG